ncbi:MAG: DEAD/DEAH box helicase [Bacilli bacterium]|nr:DEAD/DEAH box helicase [Bacilli bacterium]MDD4795926.1 DEAD/DEAH box helicase [Bacilli bacterium]
MKRSEILRKINSFTINNDINNAIDLLCELLEINENNVYNDLINMLIENFQLYGYISNNYSEYFEKMFTNDSDFLRLNSYKGKYLKHLNYGQLSLIEKIEEEDKILISAPTSFGKTSILIEYIYQNYQKFNTIFFVVPTHSLIEELYIKLLKINKDIEDKYNVTVNIGKQHGRVIRILTPERFLTYYEYRGISDVDLLIMDETYKIDTENTSEDDLNTELNITNASSKSKDDVSDFREVKFRKVLEILGKNDKKTIMLSPYTYEKDESMLKYLNKYSVYDENKNIKYVSHNYIDLTNVSKFKLTFGISNIKSSDYNNIQNKTSLIINQIKNEQNIIYISYPLMGIKIVEEIKNKNIDLPCLKNNERYIKFLSHLENNYIVDGIDEWYVISTLKMGVGIYVSSIPRYIKRELITLFEQGIIKTLIVTTAFVEGVNSSAKNIIIASGSTGGNKKLNDLSLLNIVGRAGRFGKNFLGNVYFLNNEPYKKVISSKDKGVKLVNPNYKLNLTLNKRSDYELEMMDNEYLNPFEIERKNKVVEVLNNNNFNYEELSKIAIVVPNTWKAILYDYFKNHSNIDEIKDIVGNIADDNSDNFIMSITKIFNILKEITILKDTYGFNYVSPFTKDGKFLWAELYKIHKNDNIKKVLLSNKRFIEKKKVEMTNNFVDYTNTWIKDYYDKHGNFDDSKLYEKTFRFISDIIEYKIPYYINFFINIFKYYINKENINFNNDDDFSIDLILEKVENNFIDENLIEFYDYGFPKQLIDKIEKLGGNISILAIDEISEFDEFEKIILKEYIEIMK